MTYLFIPCSVPSTPLLFSVLFSSLSSSLSSSLLSSQDGKLSVMVRGLGGVPDAKKIFDFDQVKPYRYIK